MRSENRCVDNNGQSDGTYVFDGWTADPASEPWGVNASHWAADSLETRSRHQKEC